MLVTEKVTYVAVPEVIEAGDALTSSEGVAVMNEVAFLKPDLSAVTLMLPPEVAFTESTSIPSSPVTPRKDAAPSSVILVLLNRSPVAECYECNIGNPAHTYIVGHAHHIELWFI